MNDVVMVYGITFYVAEVLVYDSSLPWLGWPP